MLYYRIALKFRGT